MKNWKTVLLPSAVALAIGMAVAWAAQTNYLGTVFVADTTTPANQLKVNADGSINATVVSGGGVPSIAGTTNQINESGSPGATTLSLSSTLQPPGTLALGGCTIGTDAFCITGTMTTSSSITTAGTIQGYGLLLYQNYNYGMEFDVTRQALTLGSGAPLAFSPGTPATAPDAFLSRLSPGVLSVDTTTAGNSLGTITAAHATFIALSSAATTSAVCYNTGTGVLTYNSTVGTCTVSTIDAKDLIAPLTKQEGYRIVMGMQPWRYDLKKGLPTYVAGEQVGLIAQYANDVDPRFVAKDPDGRISGVRYEQYTAAITAGFQYHDDEIRQIKADNDNLRAEVETLKRARQ